jgi:hypothetical protein
MTLEIFKKLPIGLYKIYWKESSGGGHSLVSIGVTREGGRWIAPTNWVFPATVNTEILESIESVYPISLPY